MKDYLHPTKIDEHRVTLQLMRHTLMHTGELRFLYDKKTQTGYTWRVHFADTFPDSLFNHYTLTTEDPAYQDTLLAAVQANATTVMALNLDITAFAADILRVAGDYTAKLAANSDLQTKCEGAYPDILVQSLT